MSGWSSGLNFLPVNYFFLVSQDIIMFVHPRILSLCLNLIVISTNFFYYPIIEWVYKDISQHTTDVADTLCKRREYTDEIRESTSKYNIGCLGMLEK